MTKSFLQHARGLHLTEVGQTGQPKEPATPTESDRGGEHEVGETRSATRPNFVIFMPDDMYLEDYVFWDNERNYAPDLPDGFPFMALPDSGLMPNLAKIAQAGATLSRAYAASPFCTPSRFSVLTGRYPSKSKYGQIVTAREGSSSLWGSMVDQSVNFLSSTDNSKNLPFTLQSSGYATGFVGKWGLTPESLGGGYNYPYAKQLSGVKAAGFDYADGVYVANLAACRLAATDICDWGNPDDFTHNMEWLLESALIFMDGALARRDPFFLCFYPTVPHQPNSTEAFTDVGSPHGFYNTSRTPAGMLSRPPDVSRFCSGCHMPSREEIWAASDVSTVSEEYRYQVANMYWIDLSLGVLYDFLSEQGVIEDTYMIILTDNGIGKGVIYETGCRIPMYVSGPGDAAGTTVTELVSQVDIAPTVLAWAGVKMDAGMLDMDGLSLASLVRGSASFLDREEVFLEVLFDRAVVRRDGLKYFRYEAELPDSYPHATDCQDLYPAFGQEHQLYNLTADSMEQSNLAYDPAYTSLLSRLKAVLAAQQQASP